MKLLTTLLILGVFIAPTAAFAATSPHIEIKNPCTTSSDQKLPTDNGNYYKVYSFGSLDPDNTNAPGNVAFNFNGVSVPFNTGVGYGGAKSWNAEFLIIPMGNGYSLVGGRLFINTSTVRVTHAIIPTTAVTEYFITSNGTATYCGTIVE